MRRRSRQISQGLPLQAFTTIELLVAMAIIIILASLVVVGGSKLIGGGKERSTKVTLASMQAMLGELDAKTRLSKAPPAWRWLPSGTNASGSFPRIDSPTDMDFWRVPFRFGTADSPGGLDAMDAPGNVTSDANPSVRNASRQVLNTQLVMMMVFGVNRSVLEKMRPDQYMIPQWQGKPIPIPGLDGVFYTVDDSTSLTEQPYYLQGMKVEYTDSTGKTARYRCRDPHAASTAFDTGRWVRDTSPPTPIMLDAWNNPIIFVPGTGLRVRLLNGQKDYLTDGSNESRQQTWIIVSPEGKVKDNGSPLGNPVVTQPGRPFFASAGPDGDFARGEDNIYSFE